MIEPLKQVIQCHGDSSGEEWTVKMTRGGTYVAAVAGLESHVAARAAAEFLRAGVVLGWNLGRAINDEEIAAGVEALNEPLFDPETTDADDVPTTKEGEDRFRVRMIIRAAWTRFIRKVLEETGA